MSVMAQCAETRQMITASPVGPGRLDRFGGEVYSK